MDYRLEWSPAALDDVDEIAQFIHRDSPVYASIVVDKIKQSTRHLPRHPWSGRKALEAGSETIRETFVYDYHLIYEVLKTKKVVTVLAVFHGKRNIKQALAQRLDPDH